jgi:hypothetical protein
MVSLRARLMLVGLLPLATKENFGEVTIEMYRGKVCCKSPFLAPTVGIFCTGKNWVVKKVHSSSKVVLRITKHTVIYPDSGSSSKVTALRTVA